MGDKDKIVTSTNEALNDFVFATNLFRKVKDYMLSHATTTPPKQ